MTFDNINVKMMQKVSGRVVRSLSSRYETVALFTPVYRRVIGGRSGARRSGARRINGLAASFQHSSNNAGGITIQIKEFQTRTFSVVVARNNGLLAKRANGTENRTWWWWLSGRTTSPATSSLFLDHRRNVHTSPTPLKHVVSENWTEL